MDECRMSCAVFSCLNGFVKQEGKEGRKNDCGQSAGYTEHCNRETLQ